MRHLLKNPTTHKLDLRFLLGFRSAVEYFKRAYVLLSPSLCEPEKAMEDLTKAIENEFDRPFAAYNNRGYAHQVSCSHYVKFSLYVCVCVCVY